MRALGETAAHLPWLSPRATSLVALARSPAALAWTQIRTDPAGVLLVLSQAGDTPPPSFLALLENPGIFDEALRRFVQPDIGFVNWADPALVPVYRCSLIFARLAEQIARRSERCDPDCAWVAGLLTPLGWLALCAVAPEQVTGCLTPELAGNGEAQRQTWGLDEASIARRLCRRWQLPRWLSAIIGRLDLFPESAQALGADANLFRVVQLAVALAQQPGLPLRPTIAVPAADNSAALGLATGQLALLENDVAIWMNEDLAAASTWQAPSSMPLLADLLQLAAQSRRHQDVPVLDQLESDTDKLHQALREQRQTEDARLQTLKLNALAEFAAGAGHEINNPLAVISGQAQYLLPQEEDPARQRSLQKIIQQTQRVHNIITDLMQYARPTRPQRQNVDAGDLIREVAGSLTDLAGQRQVQIVCPELPAPVMLHVDPRQARTALAAVFRNAIEAAPADGWAGIRVDTPDAEHVEFVVEDNGPGPTPAQREHLFDPFYSGRQAGRGRGLGLPIAWQLAQVNSGHVRFEAGLTPTRFVLSFPVAHAAAANGTAGTLQTPQVAETEHIDHTNGHMPAISSNL